MSNDHWLHVFWLNKVEILLSENQFNCLEYPKIIHPWYTLKNISNK